MKIKVLILLCFIANPVYAYIDPSTGSMVAQVLFATVATCLVFIKSIVQKIKMIFRKIFKKEES